MEFKKSRIFSFITIAIVYLIAMAFAELIYRKLEFDFWLNLLIVDAIATGIVFFFSVLLNNASVYDPYWSVLPIVVVITFAFTNGLNTTRLLFLIAICFWGLRLTANWAYTFKNLTKQDWRYSRLKRKTRAFYPLVNLFGIHLFPTLVVYACILPVVFAFHMDLKVNVGFIIFFAVSILSAVLQCVADIQMHVYRKKKQTPFIRVGLWKYSRHPNYLGEILMWWGVALSFLCVCPSLWYLMAGAVINTAMFLVVSVPMADKRQSKKQGFSEYKKQTRMLLPIKK